MNKYNMNLRNLPDLRFGGGGGDGGGFELAEFVGSEGGKGGSGAASSLVGDGIEVGGAVWILLAEGVGGMRGTLSSGTVESARGVGDEGVAGDGEATAPGGAGVGPTAVVLCDPGSTIASESCILGLVLGSTDFESAKDLCDYGQRI